MNARLSYCKGGSFLEQTKRVIALGFFDGVHIGHGALLAKAKALAATYGATAAAFSFLQPPKEVIFGRPIPLLSTPEEREALMRSLYRMDEVIFAPFDEKMQHTSWQEFIAMLGRDYGAVHLVAGHDFRFGYKNEGDGKKLTAECRRLGIGCDIIPAVKLDDIIVSSTHIRSLLESGEIESAVRFLGHPHLITGTVCHGRGMGHALGTPTVNFALTPGHTVPKNGVYAAYATLPDGRTYPALTNIGTRPSFGGGEKLIETHLIGFDGVLYGEPLSLRLFAYLREEQCFSSKEGLQAQIAMDLHRAKQLFS